MPKVISCIYLMLLGKGKQHCKLFELLLCFYNLHKFSTNLKKQKRTVKAIFGVFAKQLSIFKIFVQRVLKLKYKYELIYF